MAIAGALIGGAINAFGSKPQVPGLPAIRPGEVQGETITENLAALPEAEKLAGAVNVARRREGRRALDASVPGARGILEKGTQQIASMIRGEIPDDVSQQVQQFANERAFSGGFGGSGLARNLTARDLGLTSLNLTQSGISSAQQWISGAMQLSQPGGFFDVSSMFFTPSERLSFEERERAAQFNRNLLFEQVKAAPDPATAALGREIDRFFNTAASTGMMAAGGGMGGGGGMMGGMGG